MFPFGLDFDENDRDFESEEKEGESIVSSSPVIPNPTDDIIIPPPAIAPPSLQNIDPPMQNIPNYPFQMPFFPKAPFLDMEDSDVPFFLYLRRYSLRTGTRKGEFNDIKSVLKYLPMKGTTKGCFGQLKKERYRLFFRSPYYTFNDPTYKFDLENRKIIFDDIILSPCFNSSIAEKEIQWGPLKRSVVPKKKKKGQIAEPPRLEWLIGKVTICFKFVVGLPRVKIDSDPREKFHGCVYNLEINIYQGLYPSKYRKCKTIPKKISYKEFGFNILKFTPESEIEESMVVFKKSKQSSSNEKEEDDEDDEEGISSGDKRDRDDDLPNRERQVSKKRKLD